MAWIPSVSGPVGVSCALDLVGDVPILCVIRGDTGSGVACARGRVVRFASESPDRVGRPVRSP
ncbi:hypothetical protein GCM10010464_25500 [Pseudonocardia yunnanensis]